MDTDERALLAAIIAHPDEDTPRLVYADWLDEHADSLPKKRRATACAKAEQIRVQIEAAGLIFGAPDFNERYDALEERDRELAENYQAWVDELEGITPARGLQFFYNRGLFGEVACTVRYFVRHGAALFAAAPITAVRLKMLAVSNVKTLPGCPHFAHVHTLKIYTGDTPSDAVSALLERAPLAHLRGLALDNWIGNYGDTTDGDSLAVRVAGCAKVANLKRLSFEAAGIGPTGARALANSPHLANLELLDLRTNRALGAEKTALRKRFGKRVWFGSDDMTGLPIGYQDAD
jgi:uncharacterized protein (TIGR02996 family)